MKRVLTILTIIFAATAVTCFSLEGPYAAGNSAESIGSYMIKAGNITIPEPVDTSSEEVYKRGTVSILGYGEKEYRNKRASQPWHGNRMTVTVAAASDDDEGETEEDDGGKESQELGPDRLWGTVKLG
ncbi:MAG: hypothetical protein HY912_00910 [Desulfomonile tiedjei]|uniref:Secreted protein n=1 Tax=Desulfomonile tiedjei TaxID=2358 RepID=A0A9D6UYJ6_9BACT|nr:hypothetical protein [Desulfomonile tiedjei]